MKLESTKIQSFFAISDGISLMNMLCGFISILLAINHNFVLSTILISVEKDEDIEKVQSIATSNRIFVIDFKDIVTED